MEWAAVIQCPAGRKKQSTTAMSRREADREDPDVEAEVNKRAYGGLRGVGVVHRLGERE